MENQTKVSDRRMTGHDGAAAERQENSEAEYSVCQTDFGTVRVDKTYPYPCVPPSGIRKEDGRLAIITASHVFRIRNGETEISPVVYQSCMHPEEIHIDPVQIRVEYGEICFQVRNQRWKIPQSEAGTVEILPWKAKIEKKNCIPCTNCGRCSW